MLRYFSGRDQDYRNHTFSDYSTALHSIDHVGDAAHVVGAIFTQHLRDEVPYYHTDTLLDFVADLERMYNRHTFVFEPRYAGELIHQAIHAGIEVLNSQLLACNQWNLHSETLQFGVLMARFNLPDGQQKWAFMVAVYHGYGGFLQSSVAHALPVSIQVVSL